MYGREVLEVDPRPTPTFREPQPGFHSKGRPKDPPFSPLATLPLLPPPPPLPQLFPLIPLLPLII